MLERLPLMIETSAQLDALITLIVAALLAAVPGWDRERRHRPAGLRTHMLVGVSAAMITISARILLPPDSAARIAAAVVSGIGFLGAGVILQREKYVYDVTSAASIWMIALIGVVVGFELYIVATGATVLNFVILVIIRKLEGKDGDTYPANDEHND